MPNDDLHTVIEDSVSDAVQPDAPDTSTDVEVDAGAESVAADDNLATSTGHPGNLAAAAGGEEEDDFAKEHGITSRFGDKENRLPYSRVKKISENAVKKATAPLQTELTTTKAKLSEYENYMRNVTEFENIMTTDHQKFFNMLMKVPGYQEFFSSMFQGMLQQHQPQAAAGQPTPQGDGMPEPDQVLSDGSKVYSLEGLKKLMEWQAAEVEKKVDARYAPLKTDWEQQRYMQQLMPQIQAQVEEARTWPLFKENEDEIVKLLNADRKISLERAYQKVVLPKLQGEKDKIREEVLREIQSKPRAGSTSVPAAPGKSTPSTGGNKSIEDVISASLRQAGIGGRG